MKKKMMILSSIAIVLTLSIMAVGANDDKEGIREHAKKVQEQTNNKESNVVAKVSSATTTIELTDTQVETYCLNSEYITKKPKDKKEALESMIKEKVEYLIACEEGYEVGNEVIEGKIKEAKAVINSDPEQKVFVQNYIEALGIDEDQYYNEVYDSYKISLTIGNYKNNYVKNEIIKKDKNLKYEEFTEEYYNALEDFMKGVRDKYISENKIKIDK
ncbi:MAG: hypothetical protein CVV02_18390 [Firmicutes bacterium HGW-Firmicutes-7]|nr:MAG: hypothetical protein CVV02_18390 [Firmicutes bacterium HGW-Firmicutes-7]